ncbi:Hsp33 family molecular chaperone HslO [Acidihalobacter ferrooxydans]|uniref:Hsp33 family molecular chaperone n=1 Tax=Acidihalobacter ferrooxydans TaxID=1765967 RepID=A0A1P8UKZ6_9GAMM|nr:Hsp33 family molecular chaperone HslO [Acidihalobacter ferrooxydans]APZ44489.1 Hsp33 family molecular chaperone [Acidihalobacter ferrooxydans]
MIERDSLHRFLIERTHVRGEWIHLDATWNALCERAAYPAPVRNLLGEALAATALLSATIKFSGALTLQVRGDGDVSLLVIQAQVGPARVGEAEGHGRRTLRGLARWQGAPQAGSLATLCGSGHMALTIDPGRGGERYQGIVALEGECLADALHDYFERSEQLPTRLWLAAGEQGVAGLLLQALPGAVPDPDAWERTVALADTVTSAELLELSAEALLHRLYHEEDVRLFEREPVGFYCGCSRERVADMLRGLGRQETRAILAEQGRIEVDCEFCGAHYGFDAVDAEAIFSAGDQPAMPRTEH